MSFSEKTKPREHMRCALCGRLAKLGQAVLPEVMSDVHDLNIAIQEFTGNGQQGPGTGFKWSTRLLRLEELQALEEVVLKVASRLQQQIENYEEPDGQRT